MLFQPAIIALLLASGVSLLLMAAAAPFAWGLIRHWDIRSGSERQLQLERRTYLMSTLLALLFATQLAALLLFVFNADRMSVMFVGAMCAVGTLNANGFGFPALFAQLLLFFLAAVWLVVNHLDSQAYDYPLVRVKYTLLLGILPFVALVLWLQGQYFLNLKADVITSCCGSLFSGEAKTLTGDLSGLPPVLAMALFYGALGIAIATAFLHAYPGIWRALWERLAAATTEPRPGAEGRGCKPLPREWGGGYWVAASSLIAFVASLAGVLSFLSLYIYEHPHHHCPFCLLKPEYDYQGYWLYIPLFIATAAGLGAGAVQPCARYESLAELAPAQGRRLAALAGWGFLLFAAVATWMIGWSNLKLIEG